jgi:hypothetical protein
VNLGTDPEDEWFEEVVEESLAPQPSLSTAD